MGYTIQLQWSFTPPPGRQISLADIVLPRVLESYSLHTPARSTIQFRTYRTTFPTPSSSNGNEPSENKPASRYLTIISTLPNPVPPGSNNGNILDNSGKEDITYLFLDDRSALVPQLQSNSNNSQLVQNSTSQDQNGNDQTRISNGNGDKSETPMNIDLPTNTTQEPIEIDKDTLDDDGFEIIDIPRKDASIMNSDDNKKATLEVPNAPERSSDERIVKEYSGPSKSKSEERFKCLVVKPSSNVQPMLQNLLSSFVMGYTKSAKAAASNTSSSPTPTPLPGSSLLLTVLTFNSFTYPFSTVSWSQSQSQKGTQLRLKVFILPNPNANSIFLEVEHQDENQGQNRNRTGNNDQDDARDEDENIENICKDFLEGCLINGLDGNKKWIHLNNQNRNRVSDEESWSGIEREKKSIFALSKALRESGFI